MIQVICVTGFRSDGCGTLHPLCAPALTAWIERNDDAVIESRFRMSRAPRAAALTLR